MLLQYSSFTLPCVHRLCSMHTQLCLSKYSFISSFDHRTLCRDYCHIASQSQYQYETLHYLSPLEQSLSQLAETFNQEFTIWIKIPTWVYMCVLAKTLRFHTDQRTGGCSASPPVSHRGPLNVCIIPNVHVMLLGLLRVFLACCFLIYVYYQTCLIRHRMKT